MKAWSLGDRDFFFLQNVSVPAESLWSVLSSTKRQKDLITRPWATSSGYRVIHAGSSIPWRVSCHQRTLVRTVREGKTRWGRDKISDGRGTRCAFTQASDFIETLCPSARVSDHIKTLTTQYLIITPKAALFSVSSCVVLCFKVDASNGPDWPRVGNPFAIATRFQGFYVTWLHFFIPIFFCVLPLTRTASALPFFFIVPFPINFLLFFTCWYNINH